MVAHSREHTLTRWVEHLKYCIKVHCYYVKVYKISFLKDQGNGTTDRNPIRHWTWTSINHRTREPVGSLPRLSLRSELCMEANTEERSGFNLLLMGLELVDVPVCRNETTTEVVSPWRSEVEVEGCGELDCVKNIISEQSWRPGTGDLRVSRVSIPLPADMSVRTMPGWTENARILGLSTKVISVSGYLLSEKLFSDVPAWTNCVIFATPNFETAYDEVPGYSFMLIMEETLMIVPGSSLPDAESEATYASVIA